MRIEGKLKYKKLTYKFNPYVFARISAMKSLLLQKEEYDKILKMDPSEIVKFLQEGVYKDEINSLAIKYSGIKLVENTLNKHLERVFLKLKRISDSETNYLMEQYLRRYDFWNLKTLIRAKQARVVEDDVFDLFLPVGTLSSGDLRRLYSLNSIKEIIASSGIIKPSEFREAIDKYEMNNDLSELENMLDFHYFKDSAAFAMQIPIQGKLFKDFFKYEFDIYNLNLILKKIFFKLDKEYVRRFFIYRNKELTRETLKSLVEKENFGSFLTELNKTGYGKLLSEINENTTDPILRIEVIFNEFLLKKSLLLFHKIPLTINIVIGYIFAKEIEVKNLRTIIKSKKLEYKEDYVKKLIVV